MAAFQDVVMPDLSLLVGQKWSKWQNALNLQGLPNGKIKNSNKRDKEVARLKRHDLELFGSCPAKDEFYVVVCDHCHLPFKPQAFRYHIEKHHKSDADVGNELQKETKQNATLLSKWKSYSVNMQTNRSDNLHSSVSNDQRTNHLDSSNRTSPKLHSAPDKHSSPFSVPNFNRNSKENKRNSIKSKKPHKIKPSSTPQHASSASAGKATSLKPEQSLRKETKKGASLEKLKIIQPFSSLQQSAFIDTSMPISSSSSYRTHKHSHNPQLDILKSDDRLNEQHRLKSDAENCHQAMSNKKIKNVENVPQGVLKYDPNKHCGVLTDGDQAHCTGPLACKRHDRNQKRQVLGRLKPFDDLFMEQAAVKRRSSKVEADTSSNTQRQSGPDTKKARLDSSGSANIKNTVSHTKSDARLSSKSSVKKHHIFPRSNPPVVVDLWPDHPLELSRPTNHDEQINCKSLHPSPLSVCHFGARRLNSNFSTFNINTNFQWRALRRSFHSSAKRDDPPVFQRPSKPESHVMNPIGGVSHSILESLKREKRDRQTTKQRFYNLSDRESRLFESKCPVALLTSHSARSSSSPLGGLLASQRVARSHSISNDSAYRAVTGKSQPTFKSPAPQPCRRSLSHDHRLYDASVSLLSRLTSSSNLRPDNPTRNAIDEHEPSRSACRNIGSVKKAGSGQSEPLHMSGALNGRRQATSKKIIISNHRVLTDSSIRINGLKNSSSQLFPHSLARSGESGTQQTVAANDPRFHNGNPGPFRFNGEAPPSNSSSNHQLNNILSSAFQDANGPPLSLQSHLTSSASHNDDSYSLPQATPTPTPTPADDGLFFLTSKPDHNNQLPDLMNHYVTDIFSILNSDS